MAQFTVFCDTDFAAYLGRLTSVGMKDAEVVEASVVLELAARCRQAQSSLLLLDELPHCMLCATSIVLRDGLFSDWQGPAALACDKFESAGRYEVPLDEGLKLHASTVGVGEFFGFHSAGQNSRDGQSSTLDSIAGLYRAVPAESLFGVGAGSALSRQVGQQRWDSSFAQMLCLIAEVSGQVMGSSAALSEGWGGFVGSLSLARIASSYAFAEESLKLFKDGQRTEDELNAVAWASLTCIRKIRFDLTKSTLNDRGKRRFDLLVCEKCGGKAKERGFDSGSYKLLLESYDCKIVLSKGFNSLGEWPAKVFPELYDSGFGSFSMLQSASSEAGGGYEYVDVSGSTERNLEHCCRYDSDDARVTEPYIVQAVRLHELWRRRCAVLVAGVQEIY